MKKINLSYNLFKPFLITFVFIGALFVLTFLHKGKAEMVTLVWDFNNPGEYTYDASKIVVADGMARRVVSPENFGDFTPPLLPSGGPGAQIIPPTFCADTIESVMSVVLPQESRLQGAFDVADLSGGMIGYQISVDGNTWLYWNGFEWSVADMYSFSSIQDINANIGLLPPATQLKFKARLAGDCLTAVPALIDLTFIYSFALPGYAITTNTPGLTITNESGDLISRTENSFYARVNNVPILFAIPSGDVDLTMPIAGQVVLANSSLFAVWMDMPIVFRNSFTSWEMLLQKSVTTSGPVSIRVCPNVLSVEMMSSTCAEGVTLSQENPAQGDYMLTSLEDPLFWHVKSTSPFPAVAIYEFSPYTSPVVSNASLVKDGADVMITFKVQDAESHNVAISNLQYSTTGEWQGEEQSISTINNGAGLTELTSSPEGIFHTLVWNAQTDLGNINNQAVYIRMTVVDSFSPGLTLFFDPISLDFSPAVVTPPDQEPETPPVVPSVPVVVPSTPVVAPVRNVVANHSNIGASMFTSNTNEKASQLTIANLSIPEIVSPNKEIIKRPYDTKKSNTLQIVRQVEESKETAFLKVPEITNIAQVKGSDKITFSGKGIPNSTVTLFIHSDQLVFYTTQVNQDGTWNVVHEQNSVILAPGEHAVYAMTYDSHSAVRSAPTKAFHFSVQKNNIAAFLAHINIRFTILTLSVLTLVLMIINRYRRLYKNKQ